MPTGAAASDNLWTWFMKPVCGFIPQTYFILETFKPRLFAHPKQQISLPSMFPPILFALWLGDPGGLPTWAGLSFAPEKITVKAGHNQKVCANTVPQTCCNTHKHSYAHFVPGFSWGGLLASNLSSYKFFLPNFLEDWTLGHSILSSIQFHSFSHSHIPHPQDPHPPCPDPSFPQSLNPSHPSIFACLVCLAIPPVPPVACLCHLPHT